MVDEDIEEIRNRKLSDVIGGSVSSKEKLESSLDDSIILEETVSIDEAVSYGFNMFKGIAKYILFIIILNIVGFFLLAVSINENAELLALFGVPFIVAGIVLNIALSIGVMYKLWVDILARSRK